ncbi:MAG: hypothetical protein ACQEXV_20885 [Bacillota bacterium]
MKLKKMKKWIAPVFSLSLVIPGVAGAAAAPTTVNISKPAVATPARASNVEQRLSLQGWSFCTRII